MGFFIIKLVINKMYILAKLIGRYIPLSGFKPNTCRRGEFTTPGRLIKTAS